jgi:hypothetical protein
LVLILQLIPLLMLLQIFLQPLKHQPSKLYYSIID